MKRYSLTECYELLGVDPKTFRSWLAKAGMGAEQSKADPRVKYLTEEQVKHLADTHERTMHFIENELDRAKALGAHKLLADQIDAAEKDRYELKEHINVVLYEQARQSKQIRGFVDTLSEFSSKIEELQSRLYEEVQAREALSQQIETLIAQQVKHRSRRKQPS